MGIKIVNSQVQFLLHILRTKSTAKIINKAVNIVEKRIRLPYVFSNPVWLTIDPCSNLCNLQCRMCAVGMKSKDRSTKKMSFREFKKVVDKTGGSVIMLDFGNWGEPLLNEELPKMIKYANKKGIDTAVLSNFNVVTEAMAKGLAESGLNNIYISLDGASQETVEKYQSGARFDKVIGNIKQVRQFKRGKYPILIWKFVVNKYNEHEVGFAQREYKNLGFDRIIFAPVAPMSVPSKDIPCLSKRELFDLVKDWAPTKKEYNIADFKRKRIKESAIHDCTYIWERIFVHADGSISPCCGYFNVKYDFGNIFSGRFRSIWNGKKYMTARLAVRGIFKDNNLICTICRRNFISKN